MATEMTDGQREKYWRAVYILRELVEEGVDRDDLVDEVDGDVE